MGEVGEGLGGDLRKVQAPRFNLFSSLCLSYCQQCLFLHKKVNNYYHIVLLFTYYNMSGFPGGSVVKNPLANAGNAGSTTGPGGSHMLWSN